MDRSELRPLVAEMRALGIVYLKVDGAEIVLGPAPPAASRIVQQMRDGIATAAAQQAITMDTIAAAPPVESQAVRDLRAMIDVGRELTDEELLFASSQGWPDEREGGGDGT